MPKLTVTTSVLVAGGTGFVGSRLVPRLLAMGHRVRILTRSPSGRDDSATEVVGDVNEAQTLDAALDGVDVAFYLVHSLGRADFESRDRDGARNFARAARRAGVTRVVYLGGLGRDAEDLSPHLRSRREVEHILTEQIETVALRAAIVVGQGSSSWEILCQLVERLPVMITPRWVDTATQPIALDDVVEYLLHCLDRMVVPAGHYDVGSPDATTYRDMMATVARLMRRTLVVVPVPVLSPGLSAGWLRLVTNVDMTTARALVESLVNKAEVTERKLESLTGHRAMSFVDAASNALTERIAAAALSLSG